MAAEADEPEAGGSLASGVNRPAAPTRPEPTVPLGDKIRRGVVWSLFNSASARLLSVASGLVIARLVTPTQFGVFAVGFLVLTGITSMNEMGVSVAVVRWPTDPERLVPTATTIAIGTSAAIYLMVFALAPTVAGVLGAPAAASLIRLIALNVVLDGISSVPSALLMRSMQQGRRALVDMVAFFPSAGVSIGLAATGHGAFSLVWGSLAGNVVAVVMVFALAPGRPRAGWSSADARSLARSGLPFAATSAVYLATLNVDYVVVGHVLGVTALGFYLLAFNLSSWPANLVSLSIRRVAIPAFSRLAHDRAALSRSFASSLHLMSTAAVLVALLLGTLAHPLVDVVYGRRWLPAVAALRWLAVLGGARVALDLCYDVLVGAGRGRTLLAAQAVWFVSLAIVLPVGATHAGIRGVAIGHAVVAVGIVGLTYTVALHRAGLLVGAAGRALAAPLGAGVITATAIAAGLQADWGPWSELLGLGALAGVLFGIVTALVPSNRPWVVAQLSRLTTATAPQ